MRFVVELSRQQRKVQNANNTIPDASVHMAEESKSLLPQSSSTITLLVSNAAVNIPRAICGSMILNGLLGFAMMLTVLFSIGDLDTVLETKTGFPFIQVRLLRPLAFRGFSMVECCLGSSYMTTMWHVHHSCQSRAHISYSRVSSLGPLITYRRQNTDSNNRSSPTASPTQQAPQ